METKFMGVAAALTAALALAFGVAVPDALPRLPAPTAQAQAATTIPVIPAEQGYSNLKANPDPTFEFTVGADATVTSLEFSVSGKNWVQGYKLEINGTAIPPQFRQGDATRQNFTIAHDGLNIAVKEGDVVRLTPDFTQPKVRGSVSVTLRGTPNGSTEPTAPGEPTDPTDPTEPSEWAGSDSHGQFTMRSAQGQEPTVTFTRKLDSAGTLSGAVEAWVKVGDAIYIQAAGQKMRNFSKNPDSTGNGGCGQLLQHQVYFWHYLLPGLCGTDERMLLQIPTKKTTRIAL